MAAALSRSAAGCLLALALAAAGTEVPSRLQVADELAPALAADDECHAEEPCGLNALQRAPAAREVAAERSRFGTCQDYGCGAGYVSSQRCQCNQACRRYGNCCGDFADTCAETRHHASQGGGGAVMALYHQTSPEIDEHILKGGFKPGKCGWCGGAIYFATSPQATVTKASGIHSHRGLMIESEVSLGRIKHMGSTCDMLMTAEKLRSEGDDSIVFNPADGDEHVVFSSSQVLSTRRCPFPWPR